MTRPGLAPIAAALAVELAVALLHHPLGYVMTRVHINMMYFLSLWFSTVAFFSTRNDVYDSICGPTQCLPLYISVFLPAVVLECHHSYSSVGCRVLAPADQGTSLTDNTEHPLGIMPHQVRGFIAHYAQLVVTGHAFDKCTACSPTVRPYLSQLSVHSFALVVLHGMSRSITFVARFFIMW